MINYSSYDFTTDDELAATMNRALQIDPRRIEVDQKNRSAYMKASRNDYWYSVTLSSCECGSFMVSNAGKAPCKHMFRLAHELGIEMSFPVLDPVLGAQYDPSSDLELLHGRWAAGEITFDAYNSCKSALNKSVKVSQQLGKKKK